MGGRGALLVGASERRRRADRRGPGHLLQLPRSGRQFLSKFGRMGHRTGIGRAEALDVINKGKPGASRGRNATGPAGSAGLLNRRVSMRTNTKVLGALAIAGLVAAGGSAFTADSGIDSPQKFVGATGQDISGVNVKSVQYTVGGNDVTTAVSF